VLPSFSRSFLSSLVLVLIVGCGGGGSAANGNGGGGDNSTTVTFTFKVGTPTAVAARIGSGAFTAQTLNAGALSLSIPSGTATFALAWVCVPAGSGSVQQTEQFVFDLSLADGTSFTPACAPNAPSPQTGTFTGSVDASAIPGTAYLNVFAENSESILPDYMSGAVSSFSFAAPAGSDRVEVLALNNANTVVAARDFTNQAVPGALNNGNTVVLGAADQVVPEPITYNNVPSGYLTPITFVAFDTNGAGGFQLSSAATTQYPAMPAGAVESGDSYSFFAVANNSAGNGEGVAAALTSTTGGPVSFTFPAPWVYAGPTPAALPTLDFAYTGFAGKTGVVQAADLTWMTGPSAAVYSELIATSGYQNGSTTLAFPDLSAVSGFPAPPSSGTPVIWLAQILQSSYGVLQPSQSGGTSASTVQNGGTFNVP